MFHRAARFCIATVFVFSTLLGTSPAQTAKQAQPLPPKRKITANTPATPFERTLLPIFDQLKGSSSRHALARPTAADPSSGPSPNFGGYFNGISYPARASNSIQYDSENNGVTVTLAADFDNDGHPDVAVLQSDGILNILHNNGSGVLSEPAGYINPNPNVGSSYIASAYAVDLNGDGYLDVVAFDSNDGLLLTYMNSGGTFGLAQTTTINTTFGQIAGFNIGDVNGDGKTDVVFAFYNYLSRTSATMTVQSLISKGDGTFTQLSGQTITVPAQLQLTGFSPVALGDLNGDGRLDIAALFVEPTSNFGGSFVVTTAVGNGDGTFGVLGANSIITDTYSSFGPPTTTGVQIFDVNNDGKNDVITEAGLYLYAALGAGNNSFSKPLTSAFPASGALIFGDVNGDGFPDAVTGGAALVGIYLGKGDGTFFPPALNGQYITDPPAGSQDLALADIDGDNKIDVVALSEDYKEITPLLGNGDGTLRGARAISIPTDSFPFDTQLATVLDDPSTPYSDLILTNFGGTAPAVVTGISDGKGNFNYVNSLPGGVPKDFNFIEPIKADFNGDGKQDLLIVGIAGEMWVALAKGDGTFSTPAAISLPSLACPLQYGAAGDVNSDGKIDIVVTYPGDAPCAGTSLASGYFVIPGNGDGTFQKPTFYPSGSQLYSATLADVNGDGNLDLFLDDLPPISTGGYQVSMQLGNGNGSFGAPTTLLSNYIVSDIKVGDLNGDGKADVLIASEELDGSDISSAGLFMIDGNGDGTFGERTQLALGNFFFNTSIADMNGDSIPDIEATLYYTTGQPNSFYGFVTLLGQGRGSFAPPYNELESFVSTLPLVGNFYDDNAPDVVTATASGVGLFLGQGGTLLTLNTSAASIVFGSAETLTANVSASMANRPAPTGVVTFYDGSTVLGTASLTGGSATLSPASLATGSHSITASYSGDGNFNVHTSTASTVAVTTLAPAFALAGTPTTLSLNNGANGIVTLGLTANATFNGTISLACSGAPANASCAFNASSIALTPGSTASATLVVGTTATRAAAEVPASPWKHGAPVLGLAAVGAFTLSRRRRRRLFASLAALILAVTAFGITGCGSSGASVKAVGKTSFTITVTATASDSSVAPQTSTVNVTVQ
jgi:hypothetical protein